MSRMILSHIIVALIVAKLVLGKHTDNYVRGTRVDCTTSGLNVEQLKCKMKLLMRNASTLSMSGKLMRPLRYFLVTGSVVFKPFLSRNYRQLFKYSNLEGCKMTQIAANNPFLRPMINFVNISCHGIIRECPYSGFISVVNATFKNNGAVQDLHRIQIFPNGNYKANIAIHNRKDPNIVNITVYLDVYYRDSVLNANEDF